VVIKKLIELSTSAILTICIVLLRLLSGLLTIVIALLFIVKPVFDQIYSWLQTWRAPIRDLHWAISPVACSMTAYQAEGWRGMDLCREDYIHFRGWIGLDEILNWIFDVHIAIIAAACIIILVSVILTIDQKLAETLKRKDGGFVG
jgi:hypothetical protein